MIGVVMGDDDAADRACPFEGAIVPAAPATAPAWSGS